MGCAGVGSRRSQGDDGLGGEAHWADDPRRRRIAAGTHCHGPLSPAALPRLRLTHDSADPVTGPNPQNGSQSFNDLLRSRAGGQLDVLYTAARPTMPPPGH